jgi:NADPH-dependent 2,4-dienoyl-CoA reductase/sulfur reductase-like enzyme/rhodanese-related sulfurtransferase
MASGKIYRETYDALVLAPGAEPLRPPLPGIDLPGIFTLRSIPDSRKIKTWLSEKKVKNAVIVGGGFIGLEMAENLIRTGIKVSILQSQPQVLSSFDAEMAETIHIYLKSKEVSLILGDPLTGFTKAANHKITVLSGAGLKLETDLVILGIGVKPDSRLAVPGILSTGARGGIQVDAFMQTEDPKIWAVGDAVEIRDYVTGTPAMIPLAGPANRQGRIAANKIFGRETKYRGTQGTAVCKVLEMVAAITGSSEKTLRLLKMPYEKVYIHSSSHAGYYPGAKPLSMKLLFSPQGGRVLGAQAVGEEGVEKRIDVIAMAIQMKATVFDLEEAELCYAPQFGSAKDPVNILGMIAANALRGDAPLSQWDKIDFQKDFLLDVRTVAEFTEGCATGAVNIPLHSLRKEIGKLPGNRKINVYCGVGLRAHNAVRILRNKGLDAVNISGGYKTYVSMKPALPQ